MTSYPQTIHTLADKISELKHSLCLGWISHVSERIRAVKW